MLSSSDFPDRPRSFVLIQLTVTELAGFVQPYFKKSGKQIPKTFREPKASGGERPGDEYNLKARWDEILEPHAWKAVYKRGEATYWRRPGKRQGISATTNHAGSDLLYVFTSNGHPFEPDCAYSKFAAYALLNHGGDLHSAARGLGRQGYGAKESLNREAKAEPNTPPAQSLQQCLQVLDPLSKDSTMEETEDALRRLAERTQGADQLRRMTIRNSAISRLSEAGVKGPAKLVDAALGTCRSDEEAETGQGQSIILAEPEPWPDPSSGEELLTAITDTIRKFLVLTEQAAETMALWVVHTYTLDSALISPILAFSSPEKRCGKTLALEILGLLVCKALPASSVTPASLFRTIEMFSPTLLIDEADTFLRDNDDLRGVLNSGHRRNAAVILRTVGEEHEPRTFSTWGAKAIALIGTLPPTLEDRAIVIQMKRKKSGERVERLRFDRAVAFEELRRKARRWALTNLDELKGADPKVPPQLNDRAADNWRPLLAIADLAGGAWPGLARQAALSLRSAEAENSVSVQLLADICEIFDDKEIDRLPSEIVLEVLCDKEDRPWGEWRKGKAMSKNSLAQLLRKFDIRPKKIRFPEEKKFRDFAGTTGRGYSREDFEDAFARYLDSPDPEQEQNIPDFSKCSTSQSGTPEQSFIHRGLDPGFAPADTPDVPLEQSDVSAHKQRIVPPVPVKRGESSEREGYL